MKKLISILILMCLPMVGMAAEKLTEDDMSVIAVESYHKNNSVCSKAAINDEFINNSLTSMAEIGYEAPVPVIQLLIYYKCMNQLYLQMLEGAASGVMGGPE